MLGRAPPSPPDHRRSCINSAAAPRIRLDFFPSNHLDSPSGHLDACSKIPPNISFDTNGPVLLIFACVLFLLFSPQLCLTVQLGHRLEPPCLLCPFNGQQQARLLLSPVNQLRATSASIQGTFCTYSSVQYIHQPPPDATIDQPHIRPSHLTFHCVALTPCLRTPLWWAGLP